MAESDKADYYVGVDVGGTKIYTGVFDSSLNLIGTARVSTKAQRGPDAVIERVFRCVQDAVDECDLSLKQVRSIGVGAPGAVDPESGKVIFAPNRDWKDVPLKKELEKHLDVPINIENDCNIRTIGVYETELKTKPKNML